MIAKAIERAGDGLIKIRSIEASKEVFISIRQQRLTNRLRRHLLGNRVSCTSLAVLLGRRVMGKMGQICCCTSVDRVA